MTSQGLFYSSELIFGLFCLTVVLVCVLSISKGDSWVRVIWCDKECKLVPLVR